MPTSVAVMAAAAALSFGVASASAQGPLIIGNNASGGGGPIQTYDFSSGGLVNSFVPDGSPPGSGENGRAIAVSSTEVFYSEINSASVTDVIRVAPLNGGAGGHDIRALPNPAPNVGVQDLDYVNGALYALTGYASGPLQAWKLDPTNGAVLAGPISINSDGVAANPSADGFVVLPNGNFLINSSDASCTYNEYDSGTGAATGFSFTVPGPPGGSPPGSCTGVATDGTSLYFSTDFSGFTQTDLNGNFIAQTAVTTPENVGIEDISLLAPDQPISATGGQNFSGTAPFTLTNAKVASFSDPDGNSSASEYSATINWGDGANSAGSVSGSAGSFTVTGSHTFNSAGSFPVSVTIADVDNTSNSQTVTDSATVASPPAVPAAGVGAPVVQGTSGAAFAEKVNPEGLLTTAYYEIGLDPSYFGGGPVVYDITTPAQFVGSDYTDHTVFATAAGLNPNTIYHVRLVATNGAGTTYGPDQVFKTARDTTPPLPPVLGQSFDLKPVSGTVLIRLPGHHAGDSAHISTLSKGQGFIPLTEPRRLPFGTEVDTRRGTIQLVSAAARRRKVQTGAFTGGIFRLSQDRFGRTKGLTTLSLLEGLFPGAPSYQSCRAHHATDPTAQTAGLSSLVLQTLHAHAHGGFRTRGRYASATVRGTAWTISDRCNGTLIIAQRHTVQVQDFVRHITVLVHQGHSYLARAPRRR